MEIGFGGMDSGSQGAVKSLDSHFAKADALLQMVHDKLENEFEGTYPGNANPLKLLARAKRLQDELPLLREESDKLLAAKQVAQELLKIVDVDLLYVAALGDKCVPITNLAFILSIFQECGITGGDIKEDLIDRARTTLVKNRTLLCQLQGRAGLPVTSDADDPIYSSFVETLEEWDQQMKMVKPAGTESDQSERPDLNLELFRSKVLNYGLFKPLDE